MYPLRLIIRVEDDLYEVVRIFVESTIKDSEFINDWLGTSHTFGKDGYVYFCNLIDEVEIFSEEVVIEKPEMITKFNLTVLETIYPDIIVEEELPKEETPNSEEVVPVEEVSTKES